MVDLDLLSCFPKNGKESLEGRVGIKLSNLQQWRREGKKTGLEKWGRSPFYMGLQNGAVGEEKGEQPTARPGAGLHPGQAGRQRSSEARWGAGLSPGLGPARAREGREAARRPRPGTRPGPASHPKAPASSRPGAGQSAFFSFLF